MRKNKKFNSYNEYDNLLEGGDNEAKEEAKKEDDKAKSEDKKSSNKSEKKEEPKPTATAEEDDEDPYAEPVMEDCCCCQCVCANEFTKDHTCCLCMPLKCGAVSIAAFYIVATVIMFVWYFWLFMNEYIHWWYTMIICFLICPMLVGANFVVSWLTEDKRTTRTLLFTAQILALVSVVLICIWNIIYFVWIYKKDTFYQGMGAIDTNTYLKQSKKVFIFTMLAESVVLICFFSYFISVTAFYGDLMHGPEDEEEKKDDAASNKSAGKAK